ncbi:MAG: hypothetical protein K2P95_08390 [Hyphomonadaceae bacterium]|nr:hypothetical protein [Hyphomonadaceae bacterium]
MSKLDGVLDRVRALPPSDQDALADAILNPLKNGRLEPTPEDIADALAREQGPDDFATTEEVSAVFARYRA